MKKIAIASDFHVPYHDTKVFALFIRAMTWFKPEIIVINGDFMDFFSISAHSKDPSRRMYLSDEVDAGNECLDKIDFLGAKEKYFIFGNHEDRLSRYVHDRAAELDGFVNCADFLNLKKRGWNVTPYREHLKLGHVYFTHDVGGAGRYAHYKAFDAYRHSVVTGHTHRIGMMVENDCSGKPYLSMMTGWLGDSAKANYAPAMQRASWAHGFGYGHIDKDGVAYLTPAPIVNGRVMVDGRLIKL